MKPSVQTGLDIIYDQATGYLYLADKDDARCLIAQGYSGRGIGLNNPDEESTVSVGPIPRGQWSIRAPYNHERLGPIAFPLFPFDVEENRRSGFFIHGDNKKGNGTASSGCIILDARTRKALRALRVRWLTVL